MVCSCYWIFFFLKKKQRSSSLMRPGENYFGFGFCAAFSELAEGTFEKVVGRDGSLAEIFSHAEIHLGPILFISTDCICHPQRSR